MKIVKIVNNREFPLNKRYFNLVLHDKHYDTILDEIKQFIYKYEINLSTDVYLLMQENNTKRKFYFSGEKELEEILNKFRKRYQSKEVDKQYLKLFKLRFFAFPRVDIDKDTYIFLENTKEVKISHEPWYNPLNKTICIPLGIPLKDVKLESLVDITKGTGVYELTFVKARNNSRLQLSINMHVLEDKKYGKFTIFKDYINDDYSNIPIDFKPISQEILALIEYAIEEDSK